MEVLRSIGKYCGYYILACILIALFVGSAFKSSLYYLAGAAVAVSFLATALSLIVGEAGGSLLRQVSSWSLRVMFVIVVIMSVAGIGWNNIIGFFGGK